MAGVEQVRVGLAGLGNFGRLHAGVLQALPGAEIVAVCDPNPASVTEVADRYGIDGRYGAVDELLQRDDLDCVFIVTPENTHEELAPKVIERGLPLFMEKPLALTAATGAQILAAAEAKNLIMQIGFVLRFETRHAMLKELIDAGKFGDLITARVKRTCTRDWIATYGNRAHLVHETIVHDIDLLLWLTGSRAVSAYAVERNISNYAYPDAMVGVLQFANGMMATLETGWLVPQGAPANTMTDTWHGTIDADLEITGTVRSGRIRMLEAGLEVSGPTYFAAPDTGLWPEVRGAVGGALRDEVAHFIQCVRTGTPSTVASVRDALEGLRIGEALVESARTGAEVRL
jgi:predicted dehydrogenase